MRSRALLCVNFAQSKTVGLLLLSLMIQESNFAFANRATKDMS
jgi:hypothetical protein